MVCLIGKSVEDFKASYEKMKNSKTNEENRENQEKSNKQESLIKNSDSNAINNKTVREWRTMKVNKEKVKNVVKKAVVLIAASLATISLFACGGKAETKMEYPSISIDQDVNTGNDSKVKVTEEVVKPTEIKETTVTKLPEITPDKKDIANEEKFNSEFGKTAKVVESEEEMFKIMDEISNNGPKSDEAIKEFSEHNGVVKLPQSEWGPVYNADGSDPYICPGSQLKAFNSLNPMGKDGYTLRNGLIVPKEELIPYSSTNPDIPVWAESVDIGVIEYRVFLINNPGITLRKGEDGWGSFDRWTYVEYEIDYGCSPKWDEKVIPMKTGSEFDSVDESTLFHIAGNVYGATRIMDHELYFAATNPKTQARKNLAPSPIIDYKHDPKYTQEYVIDISKTKWANK